MSAKQPLIMLDKQPLSMSDKQPLNMSDKKPLSMSDKKPLIMSDKKPTWEQARVRQHEANIVRAIAIERGESFIQALYHIIQFYWDYKNGLLVVSPQQPVTMPTHHAVNPTPIQPEIVGNVDDLDVSDFE